MSNVFQCAHIGMIASVFIPRQADNQILSQSRSCLELMNYSTIIFKWRDPLQLKISKNMSKFQSALVLLCVVQGSQIFEFIPNLKGFPMLS